MELQSSKILMFIVWLYLLKNINNVIDFFLLMQYSASFNGGSLQHYLSKFGIENQNHPNLLNCKV